MFLSLLIATLILSMRPTSAFLIMKVCEEVKSEGLLSFEYQAALARYRLPRALSIEH